MKKQLTALLSVLLISQATYGSYLDLASFGTPGFTVDPLATTAGTQTSTGITFSPSVSLGDTIGGEFIGAPFNWSQYTAATDFALKFSIISGANPNLPFSLSLVDGASNILNFTGFTSDLNADGYIPLTLNSSDPGTVAVLLGVTAGQFTWDGGATVNVNVQGVAAVPEPSTYALLALAGVALGGYAARRRKRS
jgi:hypothetical protein